MAIERKFLEDSLARYRISQYLKENLERVGFSGVTIQRTPMVTRITVEVANPGRLIGKKGRSIKRLTDTIASEFGVNDPQIAVVPVENIDLEPRLVAQSIVRNIESDKPLRSTIHRTLKRVIDAGALGAEIVVCGKISAKGAKARSMRVCWGYLPKAGEVTRLVRKAQVTARPKYGAINVRVSITPPNAVFPDKIIKGAIPVPGVIKFADEKQESRPKVEAPAAAVKPVDIKPAEAKTE